MSLLLLKSVATDLVFFLNLIIMIITSSVYTLGSELGASVAFGFIKNYFEDAS